MEDRLNVLREVKGNVAKYLLILARSFCFEPVATKNVCVSSYLSLRTNWLGSRILNFIFIRATTKILHRENVT